MQVRLPIMFQFTPKKDVDPHFQSNAESSIPKPPGHIVIDYDDLKEKVARREIIQPITGGQRYSFVRIVEESIVDSANLEWAVRAKSVVITNVW